jgi:peroxiredoxin
MICMISTLAVAALVAAPVSTPAEYNVPPKNRNVITRAEPEIVYDPMTASTLDDQVAATRGRLPRPEEQAEALEGNDASNAASKPNEAPGTDDALGRFKKSLKWSPFPAKHFEGVDTDGTTRRLEDYRGRNLVLIFYLGGDCAHCMEQLIAFSKDINRIRDTGAAVLAIGTDPPDRTKALKDNGEVDFAMPLLSDPELTYFKRYNAIDDFKDVPLHGTFLIDARGDVRFLDISYQPFIDVDFVVSELSRISLLIEEPASVPSQKFGS